MQKVQNVGIGFILVVACAIAALWVYVAVNTPAGVHILPCQLPQAQHDFPLQTKC